jgi:hypothetical protein
MTTQSIASILRQALAVISVVMGVVTASVTALHLPTAVSSILVVVGGVILAIEHYVADPSTGSTPLAPAQSVPTVAAAVPVAPPAV